jgi:hypothetical protein
MGWTLYDCDFNQMLDMPLSGTARHIRDFNAALAEREIGTGSTVLDARQIRIVLRRSLS